MMASRWNRPSATNTMASAAGSTTGAVHPSTSPGDSGRACATLSAGNCASSRRLASCAAASLKLTDGTIADPLPEASFGIRRRPRADSGSARGSDHLPISGPLK